jgi:hypothetical protein
MTRPPTPLLAVAGALAALVAVGQVTGTSAGAAAPAGPGAVRAVPVVGAVAVCPDLRQDGPLVQTRVSAGVPAASPARAGTLSAEPLAGTTPTVLPVTTTGQVVVDLGDAPADDALVLRAAGPLSAGLEVGQVTRAGGAERGLSSVRCEAPGTSAWFVGGSTAVGHDSALVLANADDSAAVVDVTLFTRDGVAERRPGRGITVPAHGRTVVPLDRLAPGQPVLAAQVDAQRGRVSAALRHVRADGRVARGVEWVPQAPRPAVDVVVPALPSGPGGRAVLIANPGPDDTTVSVEVTTSDGQFVAAGLENLDVPAGTTVQQDLSDVLAATPATVRVVSAGAPVLAGGLVDDAAPGAVGDLAYAGAAATALSGAALVPDVTVGPGTDTTLLLSAVRGDAVVEVTPLALPGQPPPPAERRVEVPGGRTVTLPLSSLLPAGAGGRFAVQIAPGRGSGAVHAASYVRSDGSAGPLTTLTTLRSGLAQVPRPVVVRDPLVGASAP